jgi:hypothetical protein
MNVSLFGADDKSLAPAISNRSIDPETGEILDSATSAVLQTRVEQRPQRFSEDAAQAGAAPPYGNTGVIGSHLHETVFSVDWVTVTIHTTKEVCFELLERHELTVGLEHTGHGTRFYRELYIGLHGLKLQAVPVNSYTMDFTQDDYAPEVSAVPMINGESAVYVPGSGCGYALVGDVWLPSDVPHVNRFPVGLSAGAGWRSLRFNLSHPRSKYRRVLQSVNANAFPNRSANCKEANLPRFRAQWRYFR